jgi:hypothetical protein
MAKASAFNETVAARTRTAQAILTTPALLKAYAAAGGLKEDLAAIAAAGLRAEAANQGQSAVKGSSKAASARVLADFDALRGEYVSVMSVLSAVRGQLKREKASAATIVAVEQILENEVPVRIAATEADPSSATKPKKAKKSASQEAIRAEIEKDATSLIAFKELHPVLAKRTVSLSRLATMKKSASALAGKLGARTVGKAEAKLATAAEHQAVRDQKELWSSTYRLLAQVGRVDARVQALLAEAAKTR